MEHIWKIYDLSREISTGMVTNVTYACESQFSDWGDRYVGFTGVLTGSVSDESFVTFENLTEEIVLSWVTGSINTTTIESNLSSSIAQRINDVAAITSSQGIPW